MRRSSEPYRPDAPSVAELAAGAVVVEGGGGQVLLLHHRDEDRWCFPKGHVEPGESLRAAARRELEEETGLLAVDLGEEIAESRYRFYDPQRRVNVLKTTIYFLGNAEKAPVRLEDLFDAYRWEDLDAAADLVPFEEDRRVLRAVKRV
ncbi:MAG: NUDIX domain-containing protein [Thermoplasmata archaeon]